MNNKICANCNQSNAPDMRFCVNCGAELPQISADDLPPTVLGGNFDAELPPTVFGGNVGVFPPVGQNFQPPNFQQPNYQQPNFPPQQQNFAPAQPQFAPQTSLRIYFAGVWLLVDMKVEVVFDNQFVGTGSLKNGFSFDFSVAVGAHVLELKTSLRSQRYEFVIPANGNYQAEINYSRALGNFGSELNFARF